MAPAVFTVPSLASARLFEEAAGAAGLELCTNSHDTAARYNRLRSSADDVKHVLLAVVAMLGVGCAAIQRDQATETERLLTSAGFQMWPTDTRERQDDLRSMPPHRLVKRTKDGHIVYMYADPDDCHCLYVGGDNEYLEYERLRLNDSPRIRGSSPSGGALGGAP